MMQVESTSLTNGLNHGNVILAPKFGAFSILTEVVNLIFRSMST
jgi:hypothetical protein